MMRGSDACMYDPGIQYGRSPLVRQKKCHTYTQIQRLNSPKKFGRASKYVNHHAEVSPKFDLCAHCQKQKESVPANAPSATFFFPAIPICCMYMSTKLLFGTYIAVR
jgi:hypothetical protein